MKLLDQMKKRMKMKDGALSDVSDGRRTTSGKPRKQMNYNQIVDPKTLALTYRDSDYSKAIIDFPVDDALQNWRTFNAKEAEVNLIEAFEAKINVQETIRRALQNARLYGGSAIYLAVDDNKPASEELDISNLGADSLLFLQIIPKSRFNITDIDNRIGRNHGQPFEFKLNPTTTVRSRGLEETRDEDGSDIIHPSRLIIIKGSVVPFYGDALTVNDYWGYSLLQGGYESIESLEKAFRHVLQLLSESKTGFLKIPGFGKAVTTGGDTAKAKFAEIANQIDDDKGNYHTILIDKEYDYQQNVVNMAGIDKPILAMMEWVSGSAGIPLPRLFGVSPGAGGNGLNSGSGLAQENIYNKKLTDIQENQLRPVMTTLTQLILRSVGLDDTITWDWNPLETQTRKESLDSFKVGAELVRSLRGDNLLTRQEARQLVLRMAGEAKLQIDEGEITDQDTLEETPEETPPVAE